MEEMTMQATLAFPGTAPVPMPTGSLEAYISTVNRFPILTAEEEQKLARRFRDAEDLEAARELVVSHLRLVVAVARGYLGYGLPHADLIQEGNIGLMKAVKRFDPDRGVRLVSFAIHWIKAEMHEYILRNWRLVKVATTKAQRKLFFNLRSMKQGLAPLSTADGVRRRLAAPSVPVFPPTHGRRARPSAFQDGPQVIRQILRKAVVPDEQAQPPLRIDDVALRAVVDRVAIALLALLEIDLEIL